MIVHGCRNYEVLEDFRNLPQLLVVKGEIVGLKVTLANPLSSLKPCNITQLCQDVKTANPLQNSVSFRQCWAISTLTLRPLLDRLMDKRWILCAFWQAFLKASSFLPGSELSQIFLQDSLSSSSASSTTAINGKEDVVEHAVPTVVEVANGH